MARRRELVPAVLEPEAGLPPTRRVPGAPPRAAGRRVLRSRSQHSNLRPVLNPRLALDSPVSELPNVKPLDQKRLAALGIRTVHDLLLQLPFAWDQFGDPKPIADLTDGLLATVS